MAGRFRFTPVCCCGAEEECVPPCIPECRVIYLGSNPKMDIFTTLDLRDTYNDFGGRCSHFTISENKAVPSATKTNDNHVVACVRSVARAGSMETWPECANTPVVLAFRYGMAEHTVSWAAGENNEIISSTLETELVAGHSSYVTVLYEHSAALPSATPSVSYDGRYHNLGTVEHVRMICLPFDNLAQPFRFCNGESVALTEIPERVERYYVTLHGTPGWNCSFSWPTSCSMGGDIQATNVFNACDLARELDDLCGSHLRSALDFVVVRLFGWATCPINRFLCDPDGDIKGGGFTCPPAVPPEVRGDLNTSTIEARYEAADLSPVSIEFQVTFLEKSNNEFELIVNSPVMAGDMTWDWEVNAADAVKPPEIRDYLTRSIYSEAKDHRNGRIIFGSGDTSAINAADSVGSPSAMPTRWHITGRHDWNAEAGWAHWEPKGATSNQERFNGLYWQLAAISRCGTQFPEDVTGGILHYVPVAEFDVDPSDMAEERMNTYRIKSTLSKMSHSFTYSDMRRKYYYWSAAGTHDDNSNHWYVDNWYGDYLLGTNRPYIVKPDGKYLKRLIWRAFVGENFLRYYNVPVLSESDLMMWRKPRASHFIARPSDPVNDFDRTHDFDVWTNQIIFPTNTQGPPISSDLRWWFDPTRIDPNGVVANYAIDHGLNRYEMSVNGDTFVRFRDPDTEQVFYMPSINDRDKLSRLTGRSMNGNYCLNILGGAHSMFTGDFRDPCKAYIYYNFSYLAVWGEGDY